jgi:hypothetical protein
VKSLKQILKKIDWVQVAKVMVVVMLFAVPLLTAHAQLKTNDQTLCSGTGLNCKNTDVNGLIKTVINWLLAIAFSVAVLFLIIGGFWYITSAGNEETAEKGKNTAINAIIGIVIIILSWVIVNVVASLVTSNGGTSGV